jgi:hypothetical protein
MQKLRGAQERSGRRFQLVRCDRQKLVASFDGVLSLAVKARILGG